MTGDPLAPWLRPQELYEEIRARAARRFGPRLADLGYANVHGPVDERVKSALAEAARNDRELGLQYTPYGGLAPARRVSALELTERTGLRHGYRDVVLTTGAMSALAVTLRHLGEGRPDGEVVVLVPSWLDVPLYVAHQGLTPRLVPLAEGRVDEEALDAAVGSRTLGVVLSQPNNPIGRAMDTADFEALASVLEAKAPEATIVSDECHRDYLEDGVEAPSPVGRWARSLTVYSYGKRWLVQGQRLGYVAVSPDHPERARTRDRLATLCRAGGYGTPTRLMQEALPVLSSIAAPRARMLARRRHLEAELKARAVQIQPGDGTFFLYAKTPPGIEAMTACRGLADEGVLALPAEMFHHRGHVRLSVTATEDDITRAVPALARVLGSRGRGGGDGGPREREAASAGPRRLGWGGKGRPERVARDLNHHVV